MVIKTKRPVKRKFKTTREEKILKRQITNFNNKIRYTFTNADFSYINSSNKHFVIGDRTIEIDKIFYYQNILLICEDTTTNGKSKLKEHILNKEDAFREIEKNLNQFIIKIKELFPEHKENLNNYLDEEYQIFFLYFSMYSTNFSKDEKRRYDNILIIEPTSLEYLNRISKCIKKSARFEIFRLLNIDSTTIGKPNSMSQNNSIETSIICPKSSTGISNGIRLVSFMMSADSLIKTSYVLRKDNWEETISLYQRLIDKNKIRNIRKFLVKKKVTFLNNIIVALPDEITFQKNNQQINIENITNFDNCKIFIPNKANTICIIDGQHRVYAHYEDVQNTSLEKDIAKLRKELYLLVTGIIFPKNMTVAERVKFQSEIFLEINYNAKKVPADVLLHIERMKNPLSDVGLAKQVIESLNLMTPFKNLFELSTLDSSKIKISSIIKYALRYLVSIDQSRGKSSLYYYWSGNKNALENLDENAKDDYINFCSKTLSIYFNALKSVYEEEWKSKDSKLLSVICINGFIMALTNQLEKNGIQSYDYYEEAFKKLNYNFSKQNFPYTSSQYKKLSIEILKDAFDIIV